MKDPSHDLNALANPVQSMGLSVPSSDPARWLVAWCDAQIVAAISYYASLCYAMLCYAMQTTLHYAILCYTILHSLAMHRKGCSQNLWSLQLESPMAQGRVPRHICPTYQSFVQLIVATMFNYVKPKYSCIVS